MKKIILAILSLLLFSLSGYSQQISNEKEMLQKARKQIENATGLDAATKKRLLKELYKVEQKNPAEDGYDHGSGEISDAQRIKNIPGKPLTAKELSARIGNMLNKISRQLTAEEKDYVQYAMEKAKGKSSLLSNMAAGSWYMGKRKPAFYLALQAANLSDNADALNNVAAILNLEGYEEKAIPILAFLLVNYSKSPMLLNNMGQAWYGLGEYKKAKEFLLQCINQAPGHPEALLTLAHIAIEDKDSATAFGYLQRSLMSCYNAGAIELIEAVKPGIDHFPFLQHHFKGDANLPLPELSIPYLAHTVYTVAKLENEHQLFREEVKSLIKSYEQLIKEENNKLPEQIMAQEAKGIKAPFTEIGTEMFSYVTTKYEKDIFNTFKNYNEKLLAINIRWNDEEIKLQKTYAPKPAPCSVLNELRSKALDEHAAVYETYIEEATKLAKAEFKALAPWLPLMPSCPAGYNVLYYQTVIQYLEHIRFLSPSNFPWYQCPVKENLKGKGKNWNAEADVPCRFKLCIPFGIGKMKLDCSTFEFEGGEIVTAGFKHDFTTRQSTLSIGGGVQFAWLQFAEISGGQSFFVTFDENQQPTDVGFKSELKASLFEKCPVEETGIETVLGINSGININFSNGNRSLGL